jgi:hypothetical protein
MAIHIKQFGSCFGVNGEVEYMPTGKQCYLTNLKEIPQIMFQFLALPGKGQVYSCT